MKIHEYQAKQIFARYGVPIPRGYPATTVDEAEAAAKKLAAETGGPVVVVKAQIHAGGRGKGGGVKVAKGGASEARELAQKILGMQLVTHQTGPEGQKVRRLYVEQGLDIARELYLGAVVDRDRRRIAFMVSTEGGVEIEKVAAETPEKILTVHVDPAVGFAAYQARELAFNLGLGQNKTTLASFVKLLAALYEVVTREDCSLCEINPLVVTKSGAVVALDAKIDLDDNAEFRHPEWHDFEDKDEEDPGRARRRRPRASTTSRSTATWGVSSTAPASPWRRWTSSSTSVRGMASRRRTSSTWAVAPTRSRSPRPSR